MTTQENNQTERFKSNNNLMKIFSFNAENTKNPLQDN